MIFTRANIIRGTVLLFSVASLITIFIVGPLMNYQYIDFIHAWLHLGLAIIGFFAAFNLTAARAYATIISLIFLGLAIGGYFTDGHFLHMHMIPSSQLVLAHIGLFILFFYLGVFLKPRSSKISH